MWSKFDFDPSLEYNIRDKVLNLYSEQKQSAILTKSDFAFETNYHTIDVLSTLDTFKSAGCTAVLNFILLANVELAIERVKLRMAKGGHGVSEETIRDRFTKGLQLLNDSFMQYDLVNIYHSTTNEINAVACIEPLKGNAFIAGWKLPAEIKEYVPSLIEFLHTNKM